MEDEKIKIIGISSIFILGVLLLITLMLTQRIELEIEFSAEGIEYVTLPDGVRCLTGLLSNKLCPLPTDVHIKINGDVPLTWVNSYT